MQLSPRPPSFVSRSATPPSLIQQRRGQARHLPHLKLIYPLMMQAGSALRRRSRLRNRRHCEKHAEGARRRAMSRMRRNPPGVDPKLLIKDAARLMPDPTRRLFLRGGASLGALAFLSGCDIIDGPSAEQARMKISYFNDRAQGWLFNPNRLAPTYPESAITRPFPFNAYYPVEDAPEVDGDSYELEVGGLVENKKTWTLKELYALPEES